jgi:hypothetical protein
MDLRRGRAYGGRTGSSGDNRIARRTNRLAVEGVPMPDDFADEGVQELYDTIARQRETIDLFAEVLLELGFDPVDLLEV